MSEYDAARLAEFYAWRPHLILARLFAMTSSAARFGIAATLDSGQGGDDAAVQDARDRRLAVRLRELFSDLGPTFVKLGQALSIRPDLLPEIYLQEFQEFQDSVKSFNNDEAVRLVEAQLGVVSVTEIFREFSAAPVAAASLGQVYRARLLNGTEVAVKIQRPGVGETIGLDLLLARKVAELLTLGRDFLPDGLRDIDFKGVVDAFGLRLFEELDYTREADSARSFAELYCDQPRLKVPTIYSQHSTRRLLVMEWVDGVKLTEVSKIRAMGLEPLDFISIAIECSMRQLLEHGFFHADPHPGNFFATPNGDLCVLDFGMMSTTPKEARCGVIQHIVHLVNRDYLAMANDYRALGFLSEDIDVRPIAPKLEAFFDARLQDGTIRAINFKSIVDSLAEVVFKNYPSNVPSFYALIARSLVNLEGMALSIDRDYRVLAVAYPYVARRILLDVELRDSLADLLFGLQADGGAQAASNSRFRWDRAANLLRESSKSKVAVRAASGKKADDAELLVGLGSALIEDPAFRRTLLNELASMVDVMFANWIGEAVDRLVQGDVARPAAGVRSALGVREEDMSRMSEASEAVGLLADRFRQRLPKDSSEIAQAAAQAVQGGFSLPSLPQLPSDLAGDFFGQLGERAAVRALRAAARFLGGESDDKAPEAESSAKDASAGGSPTRGAEANTSSSLRAARTATPL